tara:strand:- start:450 stop:593 length:144 start_codon:yes stop_codon:yes gene_type:complete
VLVVLALLPTFGEVAVAVLVVIVLLQIKLLEQVAFPLLLEPEVLAEV